MKNKDQADSSDKKLKKVRVRGTGCYDPETQKFGFEPFNEVPSTQTKVKSCAGGTKSEQYVGLGGRKLASHAGEYEMRILDGSWELFKFDPNEFSASLLAMTKPDWVPEMLYFEVTDSLRGFTPEMALIIADDVIDCWCGLGLHYTGCEHIDAILSRLYGKIISCAFKKGIELNHSK